MSLLKKDREIDINIEMKIVKNKKIEDTNIDEEKVMMNLEKGQYFMMNKIGAYIWDMLEEPRVIKDIINELLQKYEVDYDTCKKEVLNYIVKLKEAELIDIEY